WFMDHRIRVSLGMETADRLSGHGHYRLSNYRHQQSRRESCQVFRNTVSPRFIVGNRRVHFLRPKKNWSIGQEFDVGQRRVRTSQAITQLCSGAVEPELAVLCWWA